MKIILKENIENLGSKGDIVNVAAGYGRNYLLPKKLALEVTSTNMKMIEMEQACLKKNLEKTRITYQDVIQKLTGVSLSFERKAGEKDTIFGSVSVSDIKEALDKLKFEIDKKKILLKEPIKKLGDYTVSIKVFLEDIAEIKIQVVPEGGKKDDIKPAVDKVEAAPKTEKKTVQTAPKEDKVEAVSEKSQAPEEKKVEAVVEEEAAKEEPVVEVSEKTEPGTETEKERETPVIEEDKEVIEKKEETETETQPEVEAKEEVIEEPVKEDAAKDEEKDLAVEKSKTST